MAEGMVQEAVEGGNTRQNSSSSGEESAKKEQTATPNEKADDENNAAFSGQDDAEEGIRIARLEEERAKMDESHYLYEKALAGSKVTPQMGTPSYLKNMLRAMGRPTEKTESVFIKSITELYQWNINSGETVFLNSGSKRFNQQFEKARGTYVTLERGEFPILLYDKTVRMTGEYGFVMTNRYLHIHMREMIPYRVRLNRISKVIVSFGKTSHDWSVITLKQLGSKKDYPFFKSLDAERVIEIADVLMREIYHVLAAPKTTFELFGTKPEDVDELYREDAADLEAGMSTIRRLFRQARRFFRVTKRMLLENERNESDVPADFWALPKQVKQVDSENENAEEAAAEEEDNSNGKKANSKKNGKKGKKNDKENGGKEAKKGKKGKK